jgi:uncharacterized membrane protein YkvA (DUF1232 family)
MEHFWEFAKLLLIVGGVLLGLMLVLLAIPGSRLPRVFATIFFAIAGLLGLYVISPLDLIPDIIPVLGQIDDLLASVLAIVSAIGGVLFYLNGRKSLPEEKKNNVSDFYVK